MRVLVVNPGSSSLKLSVVGKEDVVELRADLETGSGADQDPTTALAELLERTGGLDAAGIRFVPDRKSVV